MSQSTSPVRVEFDPDSGNLPRLPVEADVSSLLLVAGAAARESEWAPRAVVALAAGWASAGRRVVLVDLELDSPRLHDFLGADNVEGIADVIAFGASLQQVAQAAPDDSLRLVPPGAYVPDPAEVFVTPEWRRLIAEAEAEGVLLLAYAPAEVPGLAVLADRFGGVVALGSTAPAAESATLAVLVPAGSVPESAESVEPEPWVEAEPEAADQAVVRHPDEEELLSSGDPSVVSLPQDDRRSQDDSAPRSDVEAESAPAPEPTVVEEAEAEPEPAPLIARPAAQNPAVVAAAWIAAQREAEAAGEPAPVFEAPKRTPPEPHRLRRPPHLLEPEPAWTGPVPEEKLIAEPPLMVPASARRAQRKPRWLLIALVALVAGLLAYAAVLAVREYQARTGGAAVSLATPGPSTASLGQTTAGETAAPADVAAAGEAAPGASPAGAAEAELGFSVAIEAHQAYAAATERADALARAEPETGFLVSPILVNGVVYYRVMAGPVADSASAATLMEALVADGHKSAAESWAIRPTVYAFSFGVFGSRDEADARVAELAEQGIPAYAVAAAGPAGAPTRWRVFGGAFEGRGEAVVMRTMMKQAGVDAPLVRRTGLPPA